MAYLTHDHARHDARQRRRRSPLTGPLLLLAAVMR